MELAVLGTDEYFGDYEMHAGVFEGSAVKRVDLPPTLKRIEYSAFKKCKNLTSIELPQQLESIGKRSFFGTDLTQILFPRSLKSIGEAAFYGSKLVSIDFQRNSSLRTIENNAFGSTSLQYKVWRSRLPQGADIARYAFASS